MLHSLDQLTTEIVIEFPKFRVVKKSDSLLMKVINGFLLVLTFWQLKKFMTDFITTVGETVYVPDDWNTQTEVGRMIVLRHERIHMRQKKKYGMFLFSFLYLFVPLPGVFAYYRQKFEREAYEESMWALVELVPNGLDILATYSFREAMIRHFTSSEYFWMWAKSEDIGDWYDETHKKISLVHKHIVGQAPPSPPPLPSVA